MQIKIRVWDDELKEMTYMESWKKILSWKHSMYVENIVMLYIGVKDKNNRDIYDGDIVKFGRFVGNPVTGTRWVEDIGVIKWINSRSSFRFCYNSQEQKIRDCYYYEVIGNIYKDSELLTSGNEE